MVSLICIIFAIFSCQEEKTPISPNQNNYPLEVLWHTRIVPNPEVDGTIAMNPVLYDNIVVFNSEYTLNDLNAPLLFMDSATGQIIDYWSDFIESPLSYYAEKSCSSDEYLFLRNQTSINCINIDSRQTQWQSMLPASGPWVYTYNQFIYTGIDYNGNQSAAIIRSPVDDEAWDTVYNFNRTDRFDPSFDSMGFGELSNGDQVVVWKNRSYTGSAERTDIFAYNITADTLLWRNMNMNVNSGVIPLKVKEEKVYGLVRNHAFCINLLSGDLIWYKNLNKIANPTFPFGFFNGDLFLTEDAVIIMGDSDELVGVNQFDGNLSFIEDNIPGAYSGSIEDRFSYFEENLYFSTGNALVIVNAINGDLVYSSDINEFGVISSRIIIDPERRVMFLHNGREAFCVKIPRNL